jgi:hypothetical protein
MLGGKSPFDDPHLDHLPRRRLAPLAFHALVHLEDPMKYPHAKNKIKVRKYRPNEYGYKYEIESVMGQDLFKDKASMAQRLWSLTRFINASIRVSKHDR